MLSPCLKNRPNLQVPYLRLGFHSSYKRSQLSQDQSIGIRFAKYQIFLIWYTKHQKTTNIRYVKILNDMVQAYVVIFFWARIVEEKEALFFLDLAVLKMTMLVWQWRFWGMGRGSLVQVQQWWFAALVLDLWGCCGLWVVMIGLCGFMVVVDFL